MMLYEVFLKYCDGSLGWNLIFGMVWLFTIMDIAFINIRQKDIKKEERRASKRNQVFLMKDYE